MPAWTLAAVMFSSVARAAADGTCRSSRGGQLLDNALLQVGSNLSQGREGDGNQGRLEPAHVSSEYVFVKHGTCEEHGHHFIKTKAECQAAGTSLGVVRKALTAGGNRQKYCGTWDHNTWLLFNPQANGILNGHAILQSADGFTWQVCRKGAPSDYVFVTHGTCEEHGHHFIKTKAECQAAGTSLGVVRKPLTAGGNRQKYCGTWDHNTWLLFNPQASGVLNGHAILQSADGFTWQVCRKGAPAPVPDTPYLLGDDATNVCPSGSVRLMEQAECEVAATELGLQFRTAGSWPSLPGGCYVSSTQPSTVYFNTEAGRGFDDRRPICTTQARGPWAFSQPGSSCTSTCASSGRVCDASAQHEITGQELREKARELLGIACTDFSGPWTGNPAYDTLQRRCYYSQAGSSDCDASEAGNRRLCHCGAQ